MGFFTFLFYLAIIHLVFGFLWKWVVLLPIGLAFFWVKSTYPGRILKVGGSYFLVSLCVLLTNTYIGQTESVVTRAMFVVAAAFVLLVGYVDNYYEARKYARDSYDSSLEVELEDQATFEVYLATSAVLFYVISVFWPVLAENSLTNWLYQSVYKISALPIVGWIVGLLGVLFMISIVIRAIITGGAALFSVTRRISGS